MFQDRPLPRILFGLLLSFVLAGNASSVAHAANSIIAGDPITGSLTVAVVRADMEVPTPVSGAFVMVGDSPGDPIPANWGFTGVDGTISFSSQSLTGLQTVTAGAEGFQYVSLVGVNADDLTLAIAPRQAFDPSNPPGSDYVDVYGTVDGFEVNNGVLGNGWLDVGLVMAPMNLRSALSFNLGVLIAGMEMVHIGGLINLDIPLPENLLLPRQYEFLTWLEKSLYHWPSQDQVDLMFGCIAGRIATSGVIDWIQNQGNLLDLLVLMELYKTGISETFSVEGATNQDFSLEQALQYNLTIEYTNVPATHSMFLLAAGDPSGAGGSGPILPMGFLIQNDGLGSGSALLSTAARQGSLSGMSYLYGGAAINLDPLDGSAKLEEGLTALLDRSDTVSPPGTVVLDTFFNVVNSYLILIGDQNYFAFTNVTRTDELPHSPAPSLAESRVLLEVSVQCDLAEPGCYVGKRELYEFTQWSVFLPGSLFGFALPILPPEAPPFITRPPDDETEDIEYRLLWDLGVYGFTMGGAFNFNQYDFSTFEDRVTHLSRRKKELALDGVMPDRPLNLSPAHGAVDVPVPVLLQASAFSDPDLEDIQTASRWQVWPEEDTPAEAVFDQVSTSGDLTQVELPPGLLTAEQGYAWHVRYRDDRGMWSDDSEDTSFFVAACTDNGDCDDGLWCNGAEQCVGGGCQAGTPIDCDDAVACTDDACDEGTDSCDNVANNGNCDDGLWCNGAETCDALLDCQSGTAINCDDGVACTDDACNEGTDSCNNGANNSNCDDGLWCNGTETCDPVLDCQTGTPPNCNDGVACTDDACNESTDACDNLVNDGYCDDGLWCNGAETCHPVSGCQAGADPCPTDGNDCTDDGCRETEDVCEYVCNAESRSDTCCEDPACSGEPVCKNPSMPWLHLLLDPDEP